MLLPVHMVINRKRVLGLSVHMIFEHVFYSYRIQISPSFTVLQNIIRFNKREEVTEFPLAEMFTPLESYWSCLVERFLPVTCSQMASAGLRPGSVPASPDRLVGIVYPAIVAVEENCAYD